MLLQKEIGVILDKLWEIGDDVEHCNLLEITYQRQAYVDDTVKRVVEPVAILFSEYYFYMNAYIVEKNEKGQYVHKYEYPAVFRLDRIRDFKETGEKFRISYSDYFDAGEFRKRVQFMWTGKLFKIQLKYMGTAVEVILDRLPTAVIKSQNEKEYIIESEVYGKGILMWLLSQGTNVELLKPESLRAEMKRKLIDMLEKY